jgi:hypothetical protein
MKGREEEKKEGGERTGQEAGDGGDVHDLAAGLAFLKEAPDHEMGEFGEGHDVELHHLHVLLERDVGEVAHCAEGGVVDQQLGLTVSQ